MNWIKQVVFAFPDILWALLLVPALVIVYVFRIQKRTPVMNLSSLEGVWQHRSGIRPVLYHLLFFLRMAALIAVIVALARPQIPNMEEQVETQGIDIVMALDISSSMLARDFKPDRISAAKIVASDFINERKNDRLGLVAFSGEAFTQCPITIDHQVLLGLMEELKVGLLKDGTAIGSGLGVAVNRLKDSESISKVIILLTDGVNNMGETDPRTAADLAANFNIRVYTIGVGKQGKAYAPVGIYPNGQYAFDYVDVEIDEDLLKEVAVKTGGQYFRATDNESLKEIYGEIDQLEKSRVLVSTMPRHTDVFFWLVAFSAGALLLEIMAKQLFFRGITT